MATQKISEMTEAILLENNDVLPIVQNGVNKKVKIQLLRDYEKLLNKPTLNNVTIEGNKSLDDFKIFGTEQDVENNGKVIGVVGGKAKPATLPKVLAVTYVEDGKVLKFSMIPQELE